VSHGSSVLASVSFPEGRGKDGERKGATCAVSREGGREGGREWGVRKWNQTAVQRFKMFRTPYSLPLSLLSVGAGNSSRRPPSLPEPRP